LDKADDAIEQFQACAGEVVQSQAAFSFLHVSSALGIAGVWIAAFSLLREPTRHKLSAIRIAGAGAASSRNS
jgi:hypothetical protein